MSSPQRKGSPPPLTHTLVIHLRMALQPRFSRKLQPTRTNVPRLGRSLHVFIQQKPERDCPPVTAQTGSMATAVTVRGRHKTSRQRQLRGREFAFPSTYFHRGILTELEDKKGHGEEDAALWREGGSGTGGRRGGKYTKGLTKHPLQLAKYPRAH